MRRWLAIAVLSVSPAWAHACLFVTSTPPEGWYQWASGLFAGDVTALDRQGSVDVVTVKAVETFKGPDSTLGTLTLRLSSRYWTNCKVEIPAVGAHVLVAMNANSEVLLVPLSAGYAEQLRQQRAKQPRQ